LKYGVRVSKSTALFANFSHDGTMIVTGGFDHTAMILDSTDGRVMHSLAGHNRPVRCVAFSPDDRVVVTACEDHKARAFQVADGKRIMPDLDHPDGVTSVEYSRDGRLIATASIDGTAKLWRAATLEPHNPTPVLRHNERLGYAGTGPDGHRIVTCCTDGAVRIWDLAGATFAGQPSHRIFSESGSRFLVLSNGTVQIGDVSTEQILCSVSLDSLPITRAGFDHDGRFVWTASEYEVSPALTNCVLHVWNAKEGILYGASIVVTNRVNGISMSDNGKYVITFVTNVAQVWDVATGKPSSPALIHEHAVTAAVFAPGGGQVSTLSGSVVELWNESQGWGKVATLRHQTTVAHVEYSADGSRLLSCCSDTTSDNTSFDKCYAQIWDARSGKAIGPQLWHRDGIGFGSFSADGRLAATASEDFTAIIWDTGFSRPGVVLQHAHDVRSVSFSYDCKWVATASRDRTARVWDAQTGSPLTPWLRHLGELSAARFTPDKSRIVTADRKGNTWVWELPLDPRPLEDLSKLAKLLTSGTAVTSNPTEFPRTASLMKDFLGLREKYPADFVVPARKVQAWHEYQARQGRLQ
jgi:WD40 repeat protein